jgi:hypothetical protein
MRVTILRGNNRGTVFASKKLFKPGSVWVRLRSSAVSAALTTRSGVAALPLSNVLIKADVFVGPGQSARTLNPRCRYSAHSASLNDSMKALVAP